MTHKSAGIAAGRSDADITAGARRCDGKTCILTERAADKSCGVGRRHGYVAVIGKGNCDIAVVRDIADKTFKG